jgi:hypothetical protein
MSKAEQQPTWLDDPISTDEIQACVDAGASEAFIDVLRTDPPLGVDRHSVRIEVKKQLREWDNDPENMTTYGGGFFTALWNGNRERFIGIADANNTEILRAAGLL